MQNSLHPITDGKNLSLQHACTATDAYMQETRVMCFPGQRFTLKDHPDKTYDSISLKSKRSINHVPCLTSSDVMGVGA